VDAQGSNTKRGLRDRWRAILSRAPRWVGGGLKTLAIVCAVLFVLGLAVDLLADRPLRGIVERKVNARLEGYTTRIAAVNFVPWNASLEITDLRVMQQAHPDPPVALFPRLNFNVQWRALLRGHVVADLELDRPAFHVNLLQLREEWEDEVEMKERGWQEALQAIYPLKINELDLDGGSLVYIDEDPDRPLEISEARLRARNIRNLRSPDRTYPSEVLFHGRVFDAGRAVLVGHADFLAQPYIGVKVEGELDRVPLERLGPIIEDYHVFARGGVLTAHGQVEYAPWLKRIHLNEARIENVQIDYVEHPITDEQLARAASRVKDASETALEMDVLHIVNGEFGYINETTKPPYRVFASGADLRMTRLTNQTREATSHLEGRGLFMGSGVTEVAANFRPDAEGASFDVDVSIRDTDMRTMNDMLRAYANLDVAGGTFSFFSELRIEGGEISGYVKPMFKDLNVYEPRQDRKKNVFRKLYEHLAEGVAALLENEPRDEVVTVAELRGPVENPRASNLQVVGRLIRNAFFKAILPGFEHEAGSRQSAGDKDKKDRKRDEKTG
jgi:hypothetical protein